MSSALLKSITILEVLALSDSPRGISELSRELGIDKSAVQRAFQSLSDAGYIERVGNSGRYRCTLRIWELGAQVIGRHEARRQVHPILRYGTAQSGLTSYLAWSAYPEVVYLDKVEGENSWRIYTEPGRRRPMWAVAAGKAILAFLGTEKVERIADLAQSAPEPGGEPLPPFDLSALREELALARSRMYAWSETGTTVGANAVAAPIWGPDPAPLGSIVLASVMPTTEYAKVGEIAISMAEHATRVLGGRFANQIHDAA